LNLYPFNPGQAAKRYRKADDQEDAEAQRLAREWKPKAAVTGD